MAVAVDVMAAAREVEARAAVIREVADMAAERAAAAMGVVATVEVGLAVEATVENSVVGPAAQEAQEALVASGPVPAEEDLPP
jgi:hypothetical protein